MASFPWLLIFVTFRQVPTALGFSILDEPHCADSDYSELKVHAGVTPYGNYSAGRYIKTKYAKEQCVSACCKAVDDCNVAFIFDEHCYFIRCFSDDHCRPLRRSGGKFKNSFIVEVRSANYRLPAEGDDDSWFDGSFLHPPTTYPDDVYAEKSGVSRRGEKEAVSGETKQTSCTNTGDCPPNEFCSRKNGRIRRGICRCNDGFVRNKTTGTCEAFEPSGQRSLSTPQSTLLKNHSFPAGTGQAANVTSGDTVTVPNQQHLVVSAGDNKVIQLPDNSISLSAFAVPKEPEGQPYKYKWTLISQPVGDGMGTMTDANAVTMQLSGLKEGNYTFKITVSSETSAGEGFVNVTVLPAKRINKPPVAAINPVNQTVKLPNTDTVLDGSASTDDDKIVSYTWETAAAPMGYTPQLTDTATLQLKNLIPGTYRFKLTVMDSDGAKNSTYASVTVIKETDYPPEANAGTDVIIYLPQKEVTLYGNMSTDDKGIKNWEWTKGGDDTNKAVDMQDTRTPFLHLSNLEVGMYTFILKVTDTADQTSKAQVHVFVKPGNEGPTADAGKDQEINLPVNLVILDGSRSQDDVGITQWEWKQVSGPTQVKIENATQVKASAVALTKGVYVFQLTVYDDKKASSSNTTTVTVKQSKNDPPRANAGGDRTVELPCNLVVLNGSLSTDDVEVVSFEWVRDPTSLAAGEILPNSDRTSLLMLTNLVPGLYLFKLKVTDIDGLSSTDTASLIVKPSNHQNDYVEIILAADIYGFSEEQKITLSKKLALLLQDEVETNVVITKIAMEKDTGRVILVFHAEKLYSGNRIEIQSGPAVVRMLKQRFKVDNDLLNIPVISVDTVICQNNCSNHGSCDQFTKQCVCEAFWMENIFEYYFGDKESNCDWSILYVVIVVFVVFIVASSIIWGLICFFSRPDNKTLVPPRLRLPRRRRHRYTLLENTSDKETIQMLPKAGKLQNNSVMVSDSDSDTIFEQNGKINDGRTINGFPRLTDEEVSSRSPTKVRT